MFSYLRCMKAESSQSIVTAIKEYKYNGNVRHIKTTSFHLFMFCLFICRNPGGAVVQSVERATPGEEVPGSIPAVAARSLLVGSVSV